MPIKLTFEAKDCGQERFHAIDQTVMKHAFAIHNTLGRFCDERVYQSELAFRCNSHGLKVQREAHVSVKHKAFSKSYFLAHKTCAGFPMVPLGL